MRGVEPEFAEVALQHAEQTSAFVSIRQRSSACQHTSGGCRGRSGGSGTSVKKPTSVSISNASAKHAEIAQVQITDALLMLY